MINSLIDFLQNSPTAYHACDNVKKILSSRGFAELKETEDWEIQSGGKYFVTRGGSAIIAFTVGELDEFSYKIAASHTDSPALKLKENSLNKSIMASFFFGASIPMLSSFSLFIVSILSFTRSTKKRNTGQ